MLMWGIIGTRGGLLGRKSGREREAGEGEVEEIDVQQLRLGYSSVSY